MLSVISDDDDDGDQSASQVGNVNTKQSACASERPLVGVWLSPTMQPNLQTTVNAL